MPILLGRGSANIATEVQRWQYFLAARRGIAEVGAIDADFGKNTELATRLYQAARGLPETGRLDAATIAAAANDGYRVVPDDHYDRLRIKGRPPKPGGLSSPDHVARNAHLGCFRFFQPRREQRHDPDGIVIQGACDGSTADWEDANIVRVDLPVLAGHPAFRRPAMSFHRKGRDRLVALFEAWAEADLLHLLPSFDGAFNARYKRTKKGSPPEGHGVKSSDAVPGLSNHAFGSAFDIAAAQNPFDGRSAPYGAKGCVMELVPIANAHGFYWGGHFSGAEDGMHFELADFS